MTTMSGNNAAAFRRGSLMSENGTEVATDYGVASAV